MKLSEIKNHLQTLSTIAFRLPNGELVPRHFHVTEIGKIDKRFIDCGGIIRKEHKVSFQLWEADDYDHRLHPEKLLSIISLSQKALGIADQEIEVEYQGKTIESYDVGFDGKEFLLLPKQTDCLAQDKCAVSPQKTKVDLGEDLSTCCTPRAGCC